MLKGTGLLDSSDGARGSRLAVGPWGWAVELVECITRLRGVTGTARVLGLSSRGFGGTQNSAGNANAGQGKPVKCYNCNGIGHIARNCTQPKHPQNYDYFKDKMLLMQAQDNGAVLDEEELLFLVGKQPNTFDADVDNQPVRDLARNEDNIFQADECDAFDLDVDDEPTAQSIFMANLSPAGPTYLQASSSDASILSEVPDLENSNVASNNDQVEHEIHSEVQQSTVIDSNNDDMGNSNVIPYEQYLTTNDVSVVPSCASSAPNTAYVLIDNNVHTPNEPLVTELAIYKEQVAIYEQRAKFELTEREQRMDDQMRILIQDRNRMEEKLKQELHSVKLQLNHSIKSQTLKDKLENKLHAQDQSIQTVHMMLKPKKLCEQYSEIAIGAQNPFYLRKAKVAQPTLYDGNEIINPDHDPTNVPSSEEDLELAELARQKMHEKMNDPVCVEKRIKCIPPNYSKENFLATFTPQTQLTPEQVFWSIDLEKRKAEELKANTPPLPVLPPATVNVIPYEQYLTTNDVSVVPSCASSAPNTAYVLIDNNVHTPNEPLVTELAIYKEQVAIYEQRAKFELTEREQRMDDQMRILIQDRNRMEEKLKQELHSVKLQLNHSIKSQTVIQENVNTLQQTFKQRESQLLNDFSNLRKLKDKLENKLHAQDQSIQTVHMMLKPKKLCEQYSEIAIGAQNPFYLRKAKVAQPTLYDGNEIINLDHDPTNVPSSEEDLELAELARQKMHEKMNDPVCVEKRIKCIPPNYSKENFLATFTPQTQLTPEQAFWSIDLEKRKAEELKANTPPLPVLPPATVYPPNTPVHLVPRTLPTTSQVNIGLYVITQLFWDFEKTCKKRITPTGITEGERGFEQTKRCYLTEVIPFFNLLKEHFDSVQKSLVTEVRAMKAVFENMEAEVDQNVVDKKYGEIERKNLLITNENLIAKCLSKDMFYTATDSVLDVSRFSDMHDALTIAQKRIADVESENLNLRNKYI
ncbi:retrovirus-related pol polyprotein from transposon TNT 1-94 [Tanacetum coccineum]